MQARAGPRVGAGKALEWDTSLVVAVSPSEGGHGWMSTVLMGGGAAELVASRYPEPCGGREVWTCWGIGWSGGKQWVQDDSGVFVLSLCPTHMGLSFKWGGGESQIPFNQPIMFYIKLLLEFNWILLIRYLDL